MSNFPSDSWITSKDILLKTGISRATLNNYIKMGLIPKPIVHKPKNEKGGLKRIGYFPSEVVDRIELIKKLKQSGHSMENISKDLNDIPLEVSKWEPGTLENRDGEPDDDHNNKWEPMDRNFIRLTFEDIQSPAYLMSYGFEVDWVNGPAEKRIFHQPVKQIKSREERNIFKLFFNWEFHEKVKNWRDLIRFHVSFAKIKYAKSWMKNLYPGISKGEIKVLEELYDSVHAFRRDTIELTPFELMMRNGKTARYQITSIFCREGIFFFYGVGRL